MTASELADLVRRYFTALDLAESRRIRPGAYRPDDDDAVTEAEDALRAAVGLRTITEMLNS